MPEEIDDRPEPDSFSDALMSVSDDSEDPGYTEPAPEPARVENVVPDAEIVRSVLDLIAAEDNDDLSTSDD